MRIHVPRAGPVLWGNLAGPASKENVMEILQEWEGFVTSLESDALLNARLTDVTAGDVYDTLEASIPLNCFNESDRCKIKEGTFFRWRIFQKQECGKPAWELKLISDVITSDDIEYGKEWARKMIRSFKG